jgi:hypothetical protein
MKIRIPHASTVRRADGHTYWTLGSYDLDFSEVGPGKFKALVPLNFADLGVKGIYPLTLEADTSDATKGKRRIMLKASMPYRRAVPGENTSSAAALSGDAGEIVIHTVVSVPKVLIQDLTVPTATNADAATVASLTLRAVLAVFGQLSDVLGSAGSITLMNSPDGQAYTEHLNSIGFPLDAVEHSIESNGIPEVTTSGARLAGLTFEEDTVSKMALIRLRGKGAVKPGYATSDGSDPATSQCLISELGFDPIVRGLYGLRPLEENTTIVANSRFKSIDVD